MKAIPTPLLKYPCSICLVNTHGDVIRFCNQYTLQFQKYAWRLVVMHGSSWTRSNGQPLGLQTVFLKQCNGKLHWVCLLWQFYVPLFFGLLQYSTFEANINLWPNLSYNRLQRIKFKTVCWGEYKWILEYAFHTVWKLISCIKTTPGVKETVRRTLNSKASLIQRLYTRSPNMCLTHCYTKYCIQLMHQRFERNEKWNEGTALIKQMKNVIYVWYKILYTLIINDTWKLDRDCDLVGVAR